MSSQAYFDGFSWPVLKAFSDALAKCRFEQGDLLHSHHCAYEPQWGNSQKTLTHSIQITYPPRAASGASISGLDTAFRANWNSTVEFELISHQENSKRRESTHQGNLYQALMDGELLHFESSSPPPVPMTVKEINNKLEEFRVQKGSTSQFLLAYDLTSEILLGKKKKIKRALAGVSTLTCHPVRILKEFISEDVLPTIEIAVFDIDLNTKAAQDLIKQAVYVPVKNKKTDRERFRLRDHGLFR